MPNGCPAPTSSEPTATRVLYAKGSNVAAIRTAEHANGLYRYCIVDQ